MNTPRDIHVIRKSELLEMLKNTRDDEPIAVLTPSGTRVYIDGVKKEGGSGVSTLCTIKE